MYIEQIVSAFLLYFFLSYVEIKLGRYSRVVALACKPSGHG